MKVTAEEIQKVYANMADAEFQSLNREELTDVAQQCYDAEAARRALPALAPSPAPIADVPLPVPGPPGVEIAPEDLEQEIMIPVATFDAPEEAKDARAVLESMSIPCCLALDRIPSADWKPSSGLGTLLLLVPASYAQEAGAALTAH